MTIRVVVFDVGGVLEITPLTGWVERWEAQLRLQPGELDQRLTDVWRDGSLGNITEAEVERRIVELMCERLDVQPGETIFLDDLEANVAAASALGMRAILFQDTTQAIAAIESCLHAPAAYDDPFQTTGGQPIDA